MQNNLMAVLIYIIAFFFWALLIIYAIFTVSGIYYRLSKKDEDISRHNLTKYPSVQVLIPAYNEGVVIERTLYAMSELKYPGRLDIYLLDDSSKDATPQIGEFFSAAYKNIHYIKVPEGFPKGKSRVLNYGASLSDSKYVCVYDADNQPEPYAVKLLVEAAEQNKKSCGAVGYVKTINFYKNILTRMIALEFSVFQMIMQCGR